MPTYEYICSKCDHTFEVFQPITAESLEICPKEQCPKKRWGRGSVKRAIGSGAGLIFKGSGFYITDYRSDSYKAGAKKESGGDSPKKSAGESKSTGSKPSTGGSGGGSGGGSTGGGGSKE